MYKTGAHVLYAVGKQSKKQSLLKDIYCLNRQADKRCYYLHFTHGDQDAWIWCARGHRQPWGGREGARQALMLGYQAALTLTTLAMEAAANVRDVGFPFFCRCGSMTSSFLSSCTGFALQVDCWPAVPGSCLPGSICDCLAPQKKDILILPCRCYFNEYLTVVSHLYHHDLEAIHFRCLQLLLHLMAVLHSSLSTAENSSLNLWRGKVALKKIKKIGFLRMS